MEQKDIDLRYKLSEQQKENLIQMKLKGATQEALSIVFGISQGHVSKILTDHLRKVEGGHEQ